MQGKIEIIIEDKEASFLFFFFLNSLKSADFINNKNK